MSKIEVTLIDCMGSDLSVVNAARVSFGKKHDSFQDKDTKLIQYLAKHKHLSPFGHAFASFHVKAPIFVARQLVKHKFLRWNEISRRYVDEEPEVYLPSVWRGKSKDKKQGSDDTVSIDVTWYDRDDGYNSWPEDSWFIALEAYQRMLELGVAPEQARMVLPQGAEVNWIWTGNLVSFAGFYNKRTEEHAQREIQQLAEMVGEEIKQLFPYSWEALTAGGR